MEKKCNIMKVLKCQTNAWKMGIPGASLKITQLLNFFSSNTKNHLCKAYSFTECFPGTEEKGNNVCSFVCLPFLISHFFKAHSWMNQQ